jgi:hypothetical protein
VAACDGEDDVIAMAWNTGTGAITEDDGDDIDNESESGWDAVVALGALVVDDMMDDVIVVEL